MGRLLVYAPIDARWDGELVLDLSCTNLVVGRADAEAIVGTMFPGDTASTFTYLDSLSAQDVIDRDARIANKDCEKRDGVGAIIVITSIAWKATFEGLYPAFFQTP